jgi:hypothetical protein
MFVSHSAFRDITFALLLLRRSGLKRIQYFPTFINYLQIILEMTGVAFCPLVVLRPNDTPHRRESERLSTLHHPLKHIKQLGKYYQGRQWEAQGFCKSYLQAVLPGRGAAISAD